MKKYTQFINEDYSDSPSYGLPELKKIFLQLINDGDISLGNGNKTPEDLFTKFIGKVYKYPRFGFENFFITAANGKMFTSESDKEKMGEYIKRIKEMGLDVSKLEELLPTYEKYRILNIKGEDDIRSSFNFNEKELEEEDAIEKLYDEMDKMSPQIKEFEKELQNISKKIAKKL